MINEIRQEINLSPELEKKNKWAIILLILERELMN